MNASLIHVAAGQVFELSEVSPIGRSSESVVPVSDPRASRRHALIRRQEDGFWFFDLGSSNGSYINGRRVTTAQLLGNGDLVTIGEHEFRFECNALSAEDRDATHSMHTVVDLQSRNAIMLVSDIQGFTSLSEQLAPPQLAPIIGTWYAKVTEVLDVHGANLDKFIGDSVLAYWLDTSLETRLTALKAAHQVQQLCDQVQRAHAEALAGVGLTFRTGAALHLGPTACGAISPGEFTLLGDAVNLTFRLEALTRPLGKRILVSADFLSGWSQGRDLCTSCGSQQVKGRGEPVEVFSLESPPL